MTIQKFEEFRALNPSTNIGAIIAETLEGEQLSMKHFTVVKVPAGGGTTFTIPTINGDQEAKTISGIITLITTRRAMWLESLENSSGGTPPDCYSNDGITGHKTNLEDDFDNADGDCFECPFNQFGPNGESKKCGEQRLIFLMEPQTILPTIIQAPAGSLDAVKRYRLALANQATPPHRVITEIGLTKAQNRNKITYSQLTFKSTGEVPAEMWERVDSYSEAIKGFLS